MRLDPIPFMVARVKETPSLPAAVSVGGDLDMHEPGTRHIDVVLEGGERAIRDRLDVWTFTLNHYAATKQQAMESALIVREYFLELVAGKAYPGGYSVAYVNEESAPFDQGDIESREQRIINRLTIAIYET
jgi:hypothetical protein